MKKLPFRGKSVIVCGGSKGIGKETAKEIVQLGGSVSIVARDPVTLNEAAEEIKTQRVSEIQFVETIACDATDMDRLKPHIETFIDKYGVPDYLINAVGNAYPKYVQDYSLDEFRNNMDVNYYGQLVPTLILLPHFIEAQQGHISFVSSTMGFLGFIGYASYAPTKYALVGLAEVLRHELKPYNIDFSILFPPDTDTPGFEIENQSKPPETAIMSETGNVSSAKRVAEIFVRGLVKKKFFIVSGETKLFWTINRYAPWFVRAFLDNDLKKARKKLGKD